MKRIILILLTASLICAFSFSVSAEVNYDEALSVDTSGGKQEDTVYFGYEESSAFGDVNGDGRINAMDARLILRISTRLEDVAEEQESIADIDGDGRVTAGDARLVLRITTGSSPGAKPDYENANSASLSFYIDSNGKATVTYTVAIRNNSTQTAKAEIFIEKKTFGIFWQKLDMKYTDSFSERYHVKSFEHTVSDEGTYRAVLRLKVGSDDIELKAESDYKKGYLLGDVNSDGRITAADARLVLRYSARLEGESVNIRRHGDLNNDGNITAYDARLVLNIAAKI